MSEAKQNEVSEMSVQDVMDNKYKVVIAAAGEAKKIKQQDKNKTASLGKITIEAMSRILVKTSKKKEKEEDKEKE